MQVSFLPILKSIWMGIMAFLLIFRLQFNGLGHVIINQYFGNFKIIISVFMCEFFTSDQLTAL